MRALLRGGELDGERILRAGDRPSSLFSDHLDGRRCPEVMRSALPELTNDVPALPVRQGWGLGLQPPARGHTGHAPRRHRLDWAGLFNCYYWIDRATGVSAAIFTQLLPFFDARTVQSMLELNGAVFGAVEGS